MKEADRIEEKYPDVALTDVQAADVLNVCRLTIVRKIKSGELPSFTVGRARRIWFSDLKAFTQRQQPNPASGN